MITQVICSYGDLHGVRDDGSTVEHRNPAGWNKLCGIPV